VVLVLGAAAFFVVRSKQRIHSPTHQPVLSIGSFKLTRSCAQLPNFLRQLHIPQPVVIDLSQKRYTGVAMHYGPGLSKTLHPKQWEQYEHFSTYALDESGNIYLVPTPFISIRPTTFTLQKKIFKLDSRTGKISIFMDIDDVHPNPKNPYGINAIAYDCDDHTLWVAAIDESDYQAQKGVIYHIDPRTRTILQRARGFDALTLAIVHARKGKYLLAGSARDNGLYAFAIEKGRILSKPFRLTQLPDANEHIRKIKVKSADMLELQSIPFTYSLIARTAKKDRTFYRAVWRPEEKVWELDRSQ